MLAHLHIQNYALISHLDIDFQEGFAVMTGETGAGKSIILGALGLVMGARADTKTITEGEDKCVIEATFLVKDSESGDCASKELIIRRELNTNGRSRSFVNDEVITQAELKALARELIDIHSQHESLLIGDDAFQIQIVDSLADNMSERESYTCAFEHYNEVLRQLQDYEQRAAKAQSDADYVAFQWQQLDAAALCSGELEDLQEEEYRLSHAEDIQASLSQALQYLDGDGHGALSLVHSVRIGEADAALAERLESLKIELKDIVSDIQRLYDHTELDPNRLAAVQERISMLETLLKKHRLKTIDELIALRDELGEQMRQLSDYDGDIARMKLEVESAKKVLTEAATALSKTRLKASESIAPRLVADMQRLGVKHAKVEVRIEPLADFTPTGRDDVQFMFAANLNQSVRRVADVASGGEISRLMLCIKSLIADTNALSTIIFDEIDTGVSGAIASQMGDIMRQIAHSRQVIAITHLPQVAVKSEQHYLVYKEDTELRTETHIRLLTSKEHEAEIEQMRRVEV